MLAKVKLKHSILNSLLHILKFCVRISEYLWKQLVYLFPDIITLHQTQLSKHRFIKEEDN